MHGHEGTKEGKEGKGEFGSREVSPVSVDTGTQYLYPGGHGNRMKQ